MKCFLILSLPGILGVFWTVWGHGMVMDPPNRSSLWRFDPSSPVNYDDNGNNCGGRGVQWDVNDGKCGICGDDFGVPQPRDNENTGKYGRGKVAKTYKQGDAIKASVLITANHRGWFQFSVCNLEDPDTYENDECFKVINTVKGDDKYYLLSGETGYYEVDLQLPEDLTCDRCVLRWHWNTGNSWGSCGNGTGAVGCGPQETFRSCSDITIV